MKKRSLNYILITFLLTLAIIAPETALFGYSNQSSLAKNAEVASILRKPVADTSKGSSKAKTASEPYLYEIPASTAPSDSQESQTPDAKEISSPVPAEAPQIEPPPALAEPMVAQPDATPKPATTEIANATPPKKEPESILINFNNVGIIEYIRFVSRISNRNFVFDDEDLQFNVTIVSEEPATINNVMAALLQELRIHNLTMFEEGNNLIIHKNPKVNSISNVVAPGMQFQDKNADIVTRVFPLNTLDPERLAAVLRPLVSDSAIVEVLKDGNLLIITDIAANVEKVAELLQSLDAPNSGLVIGQYVSQLTPLETLILLAQQIMLPISQDQTLTFVPQESTQSVFVVSSPFLVERTISILQFLDQDQGATRILNLNDLRLGNLPIRFRESPTKGSVEGISSQMEVPGQVFGPGGGQYQETYDNLPQPPGGPNQVLRTPSGSWIPSQEGKWMYQPNEKLGNLDYPPTGSWERDYAGNWNFNRGGQQQPGGPMPKGQWIQDQNGNWVYQLEGEQPFGSQEFSRGFQGQGFGVEQQNYPSLSRRLEGQPAFTGGSEEKTMFYIYKLRYRKGDTIQMALLQIANSLVQNEARNNGALIATLNGVQWLGDPNSLIFTGTEDSLNAAIALVKELDTPMRQIFVEMLILETTLDDSLRYGVAFGTEFGGGNTSGSQSFYNGDTSLINALATTGVTGLGQASTTTSVPLIPNGTQMAGSTGSGFNIGVIGQTITHNGTQFGSIGALVSALHDRTKDKVISTPKLLIEDNSTAEIFVGLNTPYRTQSISNDQGSVITSNYEYRDIGTRLKVTPYLGNGDIIALDIEEEVSTIVAGLITNADTASTSPGPTTRINRTTTRVHIPNAYFLIISGMMQNEASRERSQIPCLGGVPILGAGVSDKRNKDQKRNLMIFIRPRIVDTEQEVQEITKRQQDIYTNLNYLRDYNEYEITEAADFFNIKKTIHPEDDGCYEEDCP